MLTLDADIRRNRLRGIPVPMVKESKLSQPETDLSQNTVLMIAVRDKRDRNAFGALFDHFAPRLKGFIIRSGSSAEEAEEIVQDVMLTVWQKAAQFDAERAQVSAWIYQIARNRQIDVKRKLSRPIPEELKLPDDPQSDATQMVALDQEAAKLKTALAELQPDQRRIVEQAYMGELTHQEISKQTGLPLGTIKSRIRLGLERLRRELKDLKP